MTTNDPIADMLTRIRNANTAKHDTVDVPVSKMKLAIADILVDEGYVEKYDLVDNGNRKWIGTDGSGVYVLSEDNQEIVHQFNTSNSPLLSDKIYSIEINENTGEVFIGSDKGLVSYKGEATKGKDDYSDVYAYPNPVRPEHRDKVTITGLMDNSIVKITDLNGNLVYQTKSLGGQAIWNCRNTKGVRVASGVYLVLSATEDSKESIVTKIAVIK